MSVEGIPELNNSDTKLPRSEIEGGIKSGDITEESKKNKKDEDIAKIIYFLNRNKYRVAFDRFDSDFDLIKDAISEIEKNDNYFINAKFEQIAKKPLDDDSNWPIVMKKDLIKKEIRNIEMDQIISNSLIEKCKNDLLSNEETEQIFSEYRDFNPEYFYWLDDHDRKDDYDEKYIKDNYNIIPKIAESEYSELQITRDSCYSKMSNRYAAIYTPKGNIDSFFQIDQKLNAENENNEKNNGNISESSLEYFLNKFKKCGENNEAEGMHYYLQIRKNLPEEIAEDIDAKLNLSIPKELDKDFNSMYEFDEIVSSFGIEITEHFKKLDEGKKKYLINELDLLLKHRQEKAGEKYFGYCSEDIEMLDFYKSFMMHNPNSIKPTAHFSICYYLYLRKDLPKDLVEEFEKKYSIEIPENLESFDDLDDYSDSPDEELLFPFKEPFLQKMEGIDEKMLSMDFIKMQQYLYDKIDDLDSKIKSTKIQPKRLDIEDVLEKEGFKRESMSGVEYEKLILTYKTLIELPMREKIEGEFDIELKNFSIREQVQFVNFLSSKTVEEVERVKRFLNQSKDFEAKNNRIRSFLSLESGEEMGEKILDIGEKLEPENADAIFAKYAEIIDLTEKSRDELENLFKNKKEISDEEIDKIVQNLMKKASCVLTDFAEKIKDGEIIDEKKIIMLLENYIIDLILTSSTFKTLKKDTKRDDINIEDFKGVTFEKSSIGEMTNNGKLMEFVDDIYDQAGNDVVSEAEINSYFDKEKPLASETEKESVKKIIRMVEIYRENYEKTPKLQNILVETFKQKLREEKEDINIYSLMKNDRLYAFCRFDDIGDGKKHAASLNVDKIMQESAIGRSFLKKCIEIEEEDAVIIAECSFRKKVGSSYLEDFGFIATEVYDFEGEPSIRIEKNKNNSYHYKSYSQEDVVKEHHEKFLNNKFKASSDQFILKFKENNEECLSIAKRLLGEDYIMSRYFFDKGDINNEFYCAFEKGSN